VEFGCERGADLRIAVLMLSIEMISVLFEFEKGVWKCSRLMHMYHVQIWGILVVDACEWL
jgi:hypothetical protein